MAEGAPAHWELMPLRGALTWGQECPLEKKCFLRGRTVGRAGRASSIRALSLSAESFPIHPRLHLGRSAWAPAEPSWAIAELACRELALIYGGSSGLVWFCVYQQGTHRRKLFQQLSIVCLWDFLAVRRKGTKYRGCVDWDDNRRGQVVQAPGRARAARMKAETAQPH